MSAPLNDMNPSQMDLTLEFRFANGSSSEFYATDEAQVRESLRLLAAPRLFAQPHLLLASPHMASMIPCKGIDMILAHTTGPLPVKFPLDFATAQFDAVEQPIAWLDEDSAAMEEEPARHGQPRRHSSQVEIHTLGGWAVTLDTVAVFRGLVQDERQFFSHLPELPTIPFRLEEGGFGLINTLNILRVTACPKPETLAGIALPLTLRQ
ncbi:MAG TPA: hypothetical protein VJ505_14795 [Holophagaceae bacterium]|nr:hypothetical protein [Holophagaceae bacterium]